MDTAELILRFTTISDMAAFLGAESFLAELDTFINQVVALKEALRIAPGSGLWACSDQFRLNMKGIKEQCKVTSDICTRIGVLGVNAMVGEVRESILEELQIGCRNIYGLFMTIISFNELSIVLADQLCLVVRSELSYVLELIKLTQLRDCPTQSINSAIGMVWKANDQAQKLPESNKIAYRRQLLKDIAVIDDSMREFNEAVNQARILLNENSDQVESDEVDADDIDDDDELADDMGDYSAPELSFVEDSILFLVDSQKLMKITLSHVTNCMNGLFESDSDGTVRQLSSTWTANVVSSVSLFQESLTDVGAELYHPVNIATVRHHKNLSVERAQHLFNLLQHTPWISNANDNLPEKPNIDSLVQTIILELTRRAST